MRLKIAHLTFLDNSSQITLTNNLTEIENLIPTTLTSIMEFIKQVLTLTLMQLDNSYQNNVSSY